MQDPLCLKQYFPSPIAIFGYAATHKLAQLTARGIECKIRYVSSNTSHPKVVKPTEARAIADASLKLALVYETWGGANNFAHNDITAESDQKHGALARDYAPKFAAPDNTIIYFAIDTDCSARQYEHLVRPYLVAAQQQSKQEP